MSRRPSPKPWPMKYVALAILVCLGLYTFLTLHFRKTGHVYQPYEDNKNRVVVHRLKEAGYARIPAEVERLAETQATAFNPNGALASPKNVPGGISPDLAELLIDAPRLPQSYTNVRATTEANSLFPYTLQFTCTLPDNHRLHANTYVYVKDKTIAIVNDFDQIEGDLLSRTPQSMIEVTLRAGALAKGDYVVTLVGQTKSKQWNLQVH
ncbi:MAG TPA: hypothetical protein VFT72_14580 [Opitutaceae bacterium]|nr:hypothetical protein [Opitutaceae bacterium]